MKGWFASSVCVKEPRLLETQRMKEINAQHNTQDSTQAPQPKAISPSLLWPWNDHILLLFPHLHWEDKTHTELIVSPQTSDSHWFSLFFSKRRRALFNWQIRLPFLARLGYPKAFWVSGNAVICLIAHLSAWAGTEKDIVPSTILVLEKMPKSGSTLPSDMQYSKTGFSTGNLPSPQGSDADALTTPDGRVQCHGFFYLSLSPVRGADKCAAARPLGRADCRSSDIIWGQMWRISDSHSFYWPLFLILTRPSWEPGGSNWSIACK